MGWLRIYIAIMVALYLHYAVDPGGWRDAAFLCLGWWLAWAAFAAPPLSELMRGIGRFIEELAR